MVENHEKLSLLDFFPIGLNEGMWSYSLLSGLGQAMIIIVGTRVFQAENDKFSMMGHFMLFILGIVTFTLSKKKVAMIITEKIEKKIAILREMYVRKYSLSPLRLSEKIGHSSVYTALSRDLNQISELSKNSASVISSVMVLFICLSYISILSIMAFFLTILFLILGIIFYLFIQRKAEILLKKMIATENEYFKVLFEIIHGQKEIKLNTKRESEIYQKHLNPLAEETASLKVSVLSKFSANYIVSLVIIFLMMAFFTFAPVFPQLSLGEKGQIVAIILFIYVPIGDALSSIPIFAQAQMSLFNLKQLFNQFGDDEPDGPFPENQEIAQSSIQLRGVEFLYDDEFTLGPIDLTINKGSITFLMGGNGSGKSTLLKIISGLYLPQQGKIWIENPVNGEIPSNDHHYREFISAVFYDAHIFPTLFTSEISEIYQFEEILQEFKIDKKVFVSNRGKLDGRELSTGEKKRLALVVALMDRRPILVLDEWAAEQDPGFRRYFYEKFLPKMKKQGVTVIAAVHDERYSGVADHIIKLERGKRVSI